jgi:hypothetical protein
MAATVTCITVIDEAENSVASSLVLNDWNNFRLVYPNRIFYVLDPGGGSFGYIPPTFQNDSQAFGPIAVNRDNGNTANTSNWFNICGLNNADPGSVVSLAVDTSGSMTLATVQASYNQFITACANAQFVVVVNTTFPNERWIPPHNIAVPPNISITNVSALIIGSGDTVSISYTSAGDISEINLDIETFNPVSQQTQSNLLLDDTVSFTPTQTTLYTFEANGPEGTATDSVQIIVASPPTIDEFSATPNPQESVAGIPLSTTTLAWQVTSEYDVTIQIYEDSIDPGNLIGTFDTLAGDIPNVDTELQSDFAVNSPAQRTYILVATNVGGTSTSNLVVNVFNDNTPDDYFVPSLNNVEPNTLYSIKPLSVSTNSTVDGMDMNFIYTGGPGTEVSNDGGLTWTTGSLLCFVGLEDGLRVRVTSEPFNQNFPGQPATSQNYFVTIGSLTRFFNITTRAPDDEETFDIPNFNDYVPFPDIDTIVDVDPSRPNQSTPYIETTPAPLDIDDVEIEVPIRTNDPNVQVRIKKSGSTLFGPWQDITEI